MKKRIKEICGELDADIYLKERTKDNKNKPEQDPYTNIIKYKNYDELLGME